MINPLHIFFLYPSPRTGFPCTFPPFPAEMAPQNIVETLSCICYTIFSESCVETAEIRCQIL